MLFAQASITQGIGYKGDLKPFSSKGTSSIICAILDSNIY